MKYICLHMYDCVRICINEYVYMYHLYVCACVCIHISAKIYIHVCVCSYICMYICMYAFMYLYIHLCIYVFIYVFRSMLDIWLAALLVPNSHQIYTNTYAQHNIAFHQRDTQITRVISL